jgi:parvulin-like peptidyl-prolyl isomerase
MAGLLVASCNRGGQDKKEEKRADRHGIVAVVNGEPIFLKDVRREMGSDQASVGDSTANFVLQNLIDQLLLLQEAKRLDIKVPRELISKLAFGNRNATSAKEGRWERRLEDLWLIGRAAEAICSVKPPSDTQVKNYYDTHKDKFFVKDGVVLRQIVLGSEEDARKLRKDLMWKGLKDFEKAAKEHSIAPEGVFGGRLGLIEKGDEPPGLDVVFNLKPGKVSDVVKTDYGYHLFFVEKRVKDWYLPLEKVKGEIRKILVSQEGNVCLRDWLKEARARAKIEIYRKELMALVEEGE